MSGTTSLDWNKRYQKVCLKAAGVIAHIEARNAQFTLRNAMHSIAA